MSMSIDKQPPKIQPGLPPHDDDAERGILGGILLDNDAFYKVDDLLKPDDFYRPAHQVIYRAMQHLAQNKQAIDLVTLASRIRDMELLDNIGGPPYLAGLVDAVPTAAHIQHYADIVTSYALRRNVISCATDIVTKSFAEFPDTESYIDYVEQNVFEVTKKRKTQEFTPLRQVVHNTFQLIEELYERDEHITGVASGFEDMDAMTSGFQKGDLIILAARPSMGKTSFLLNITSHAAIHLKKAVAVFTLEMSKEQLVLRMITGLAQIDAHVMRTGKLKESDWPKLTQTAGILSEASIFIDDTAAITVQDVRAKARRLKLQNTLDMIVVDYLQLMRGSGRYESREREISEISRGLKAIAKELDVPVIALSQLNRSLESRMDKRPMMSDLRESGAIEQDADIIGFIYRDEVYNQDSEEKGTAEIIISKQRNGPIGTVRLAWLPQYTTFKSLAPDYMPPQ